jgi:hypothetical protein
MKMQWNRWALVVTICAAGWMSAGCPAQGVVCSANMSACGEQCRDLQSDARSCGACNVRCQDGEVCQAGACVCPSDTGVTSCAGACVVLQSDPGHCGACANACRAIEACEQGVCVSDCGEGFTQCGASCVALATDARHCGACESGCEQAQRCVDGQCTYPVVAACFTHGQLVGVDPRSGVQSPRQPLGSGPQSLAASRGVLLCADGLDQQLYQANQKTLGQLDRTAAIGAQANHVVVDGDHVYVVNSGDGTLQILAIGGQSPTGLELTSVGQVQLGQNSWPQVMTKVGERVYVTLYGGFDVDTIPAGQKVAVIDVSDKAAPQQLHTWDLSTLNLRTFEPSSTSVPRPQGITHLDGTLYVALNNLTPFYAIAGPAYVATIALADGAMGAIELPESCLEANWILPFEDRLVVSCGGRAVYDPSTWALVSVEATGLGLVHPTDGTVQTLSLQCPEQAQGCPVARAGRFAISGKEVFVADQNAGRLFVVGLEQGQLVPRRTPAAGEPLVVCPTDPLTGYSNVADVLGMP